MPAIAEKIKQMGAWGVNTVLAEAKNIILDEKGKLWFSDQYIQYTVMSLSGNV